MSYTGAGLVTHTHSQTTILVRMCTLKYYDTLAIADIAAHSLIPRPLPAFQDACRKTGGPGIQNHVHNVHV